MALSIVASSTAQGDATSGAISITLPGTPQAGDTYIVMAVGFKDSTSSLFMVTSDPWITWMQAGSSAPGGGIAMFGRDWKSGDATSMSVADQTPSTNKFIFLAAYLVRPAAGNVVRWAGWLQNAATTSSSSTDSLTLVGGKYARTIQSGMAIFHAHGNNNKGTVYSNWLHGAFAETEDYELTAGAGSPSNWSSAGFASGITTSTSTTVTVDHDDTGSGAVWHAALFVEWPHHAKLARRTQLIRQINDRRES